MMNILACANCGAWQRRIEMAIKDYIIEEEYDMQLVFSTSDASEVREYLDSYPQEKAFYILQFQCEETDFDLASRIRNEDPHGIIVLVSHFGDCLPSIFESKLEVMDFIVEKDIKVFTHRLRECVKVANSRYSKTQAVQKDDIFQVRNGREIAAIPVKDIHFFVSHPDQRKVICYFENKHIEFKGVIKDIANANPLFFRSHMSYVVNKMKVKRIDRQTNRIEMANGKVALVAPRKIPDLLKMISTG